jgi:CRISPR/Cas system-associated exonuclease Cas4 (RecB family)
MDADSALTSDGFELLQQTTLDARISVYPARAFWPSSLGHPCDRHIAWRFTKWEVQRRHEPMLESIFEAGRRLQPALYERLEAMGFEVIRESDRPREYRIKNARISGRPDGKIRAWRGEFYHPARILEAKTMSGYAWERVRTVDDLRNAPTHWTRSYYAQGQLYCFLEDTPYGVFVLLNKLTGWLKLIPYEMDFSFVESLLQRVARLQPMIEADVDPEPIAYDPSICGDCAFGHICYPPRDFGPGVMVLDDAVLLDELLARERLAPVRAEYEDLDKTIKAKLKHQGVANALVGPFRIAASERAIRGYTVPARTDMIYEIKRRPDAEPAP